MEKEAAPANRAWVIGVILIVIIGILGVLIYTKFSLGGETTDPTIQTVQVKLLVDESCEYCPQTSTILAKLDESKIKYELKKFDIHSEEGQVLIEEFDIAYAPTVLISVQGLDQNSSIQLALQGQFVSNPPKTKKGWIIVPELFLDKQPKLLSFIETPTTCNVTPGKISIIAQLDFGDCKPCIEAQKNLNIIQTKFPEVEVTYSPILYQRTTLKAMNAALLANKGAVCADNLGYLNDYAECSFFNTQFHGSLDINYMKSCIIEAGAKSKETQNAFVSCVQDTNSGAEQELIENTKLMHKWNPIKYTPSFVIDCTYSFVGQNSIAPYLCSFHPELEGCQDIVDTINSDQNTTSDTNATSDANDS